MEYKSPIEQTFYLGRNLADLTDRHYALFANNQHPLQLQAYESYNSFLRDLNDKGTAERSEALGDRFEEVANSRLDALDRDQGESLSIEDLSDIYIQVKGEQRSQQNMSLNTVGKDGNIADYLESRRPFGSAQ